MNSVEKKIVLNDRELLISSDVSLQSILEENEITSRSGIAVAVNNKVIRRDDWKTFQLGGGEKILVIQATQGG